MSTQTIFIIFNSRSELTIENLMKITDIVIEKFEFGFTIAPLYGVGAAKLVGAESDILKIYNKKDKNFGPFSKDTWEDWKSVMFIHFEEDEDQISKEERERCAKCKRQEPHTLEEENDAALSWKADKIESDFCILTYPELIENEIYVLRFDRDNRKLWKLKTKENSKEYKSNLFCDVCCQELLANNDLEEVVGYCYGCLASDHNGVICKLCNKSYICMHSPTQGVNCASSVMKNKVNDRWIIVGGYGSDFDMSIHEFRNNDLGNLSHSLEKNTIDPVCDNCFRQLIAIGAVIDTEETDHII